MKRLAIFSAGLIFLLSSAFLSCSELPIGQIATNKTPPSPLTNVDITPTYGGAYVTYTLPNEQDISYVKCEFTYNGKKRTVRSSIYKNHLEIDGLGDPEEIELKICVVNHSEVESKPHIEKFIPLEPPVSFILNSFRVEPSFGGIKIHWENPTRIMAGISFLAADDNGVLELKDMVFSSLPTGTKSLRGFNTDLRTFAMSITDKYENEYDTVKFQVEPFYEVMIDKSLFKRVPLTGDNMTTHDNRPIEKIWDGIYFGGHYDIWHTIADAVANQGLNNPQTFTIDLGVMAQLSRVVVYNRSGDNDMYAYDQHNLRRFDVWGTDQPMYTGVQGNYETSTNPYYSDNSWKADWKLLAECEVIKPSGSPRGTNTPEDIAAHYAGFEFEFTQDVPKVRYIRFVVNETWSRTAALHICEIDVFGDDRE